MKIYSSTIEMQEQINLVKAEGGRIGFVPTMGALHQGHLSLIARSQSECNLTICSIFVNPTQFNDKSDFDKYPRNLDADIEKLESVDCDILFCPSVAEMYENPLLSVSHIDIGILDTILEGERRPGHYQGVCTIVEKLLKATLSDRVYMGLKDYQQVKVVEHLVNTRKMPVKIIGCDTLREPSGLAMSSRNVRLSEESRAKASAIYQALSFIKSKKNIDTPNDAIQRALVENFNEEFKLEYLELRDAKDLSIVDLNQWNDQTNYVILIATWLEGVRLIDNLEF